MQIKNEKPEEGLEEYVPNFITDREQELILLKQALDSGDFESLRKKAHDWKGFSRPFGFLHLEKIGIQLEIAAKSSSQSECASLLDETEKYLQLKKEQLQN